MSEATTPDVTEETVAEAAPTNTAEAAPTTAEPAARTTDAPSSSSDANATRENPRKIREGIVVSNSMDKTAVVEAVDRVRHRRYAKTVQRSTRLFTHDENNDANVGDRVRIQETRPLSKKKRWRLVDIIERAR